MGRIISSIWQTIDGVIDASTMDNWFAPFHSDERGEYINETIHDCEAMLYGRVTYEMLSGYWSQQKDNAFGVADKLNNTKKYLVSKSLKEANWGETTIIDGDVAEEIRKIKQTTKGNILIQGSASIVNLLLQEKLLDVLKLLTNPHIVGSGKRLFESELNQQLVLTHEKQIDNGVIISTYKPKY
jgi:dihydrofolate reductase